MSRLALLGALTASLLAVACGQAGAAQDQRTSPRVRPRQGHRSTSFAVSFTLRSPAGHQGVMETSYRIAVGSTTRSSARCAPPSPDPVQRGARGSVARVPLRPPPSGWCRGRYRVTVFLQRGPYCPKPSPGEPPQACPLFATQDVDTGEAHFTVR